MSQKWVLGALLNLGEVGGAPRNPTPRNRFLVWLVKSPGCHGTDAFGGKTYLRVHRSLLHCPLRCDGVRRVACLRGGRGLLTEMLLPRIARRGTACQISTRGYTVSVRRFPSFRTQTLENLSRYLWKKRFLSNPAPGENLLSGNLVMETGCKLDKLELINLSWMRVSNRVIPPSEAWKSLPRRVPSRRRYILDERRDIPYMYT